MDARSWGPQNDPALCSNRPKELVGVEIRYTEPEVSAVVLHLSWEEALSICGILGRRSYYTLESALYDRLTDAIETVIGRGEIHKNPTYRAAYDRGRI